MSLRYLLFAALCAGSLASCQSMRTASVRNSFVHQQATPAPTTAMVMVHDSQGPEPTQVLRSESASAQ